MLRLKDRQTATSYCSYTVIFGRLEDDDLQHRVLQSQPLTPLYSTAVIFSVTLQPCMGSFGYLLIGKTSPFLQPHFFLIHDPGSSKLKNPSVIPPSMKKTTPCSLLPWTRATAHIPTWSSSSYSDLMLAPTRLQDSAAIRNLSGQMHHHCDVIHH